MTIALFVPLSPGSWFPRTPRSAKWSRPSPRAAVSRAPASPPSWTCIPTSSRWTSANLTSRRVSDGQAVNAVLDAYPDWTIPAKVRTVIPTADRQKATVKVRISVTEPDHKKLFDPAKDPRILPDMGVKVTFPGERTKSRCKKGSVSRRRSGASKGHSPRTTRPSTFSCSKVTPSNVAPSLPVRLAAPTWKFSLAFSRKLPSSLSGPESLRDGQSVQIQK